MRMVNKKAMLPIKTQQYWTRRNFKHNNIRKLMDKNGGFKKNLYEYPQNGCGAVILSFLTPKFKISFKNVVKSEQNHHNFIHNTLKTYKVEDFNPFVSSY